MRDLEICPSKDFVDKRIRTGHSTASFFAIQWVITGQGVTINAPGEMLDVKIIDLRGRLISRMSHSDMVRWDRSGCAGVFAVIAHAGKYKCQFTLPVE